MTTRTPGAPRVYQNHHLDSTRWEVLQPRDDDILITTSYKSGTTWTQHIVNELVHGQQDELPRVNEISPWPDNCFNGVSREDLAAQMESLTTRRFLKSHLPLDGLPYFPQIKYIIVARDCRDVFMSLFNHYSNYTDLAFALMNGENLVGEVLPPCPADPREFWRQWITRGWFEWESEGYPFWSNMRHTQTFWDYKHLPNFLFLHYGDMLKDLPGSIRRIARFLDIAIADDDVERITSATTFSNIKKQIGEIPEDQDIARMIFKGGAGTFYYKGSNGRWRDVLTPEDLALYEEAMARVLTPDCAAWLENGGSFDPLSGSQAP